uniref:Uncharacterized protein n=1 Tax=Romanomermis culicivorax TaxID=13658 RepID=A0A915IHV5_ROMCU
MAAHHTLNFDQIMPPPTKNITQSSALPAQVPPISAKSGPANSHAPLPLSQNSTTSTTKCASPSAVSQILPPSTAGHANNDTIVARTDSSDSFINIDPLQAPAVA